MKSWVWLVAAVPLFIAGICCGADANAPISQELRDAVKSLKSPDADARQKVYDLIAAKGDARLVPALRAFKDQRLQDRDGRLVIWGDPVVVPGKGKGFPIFDAFTGELVKDPSGADLYVIRDKVDLGAPGMMRIPVRARHEQVSIVPELISSLSLLDPDEDKRVASISDVGDRSIKALYSTDWATDLSSGLDRDETLIKGQLNKPLPPDVAKSIQAGIAAIDQTKREISAQVGAGRRLAIRSDLSNKLKSSLKDIQTAVKNDSETSQLLGGLLAPLNDYDDTLDRQSKAIEDCKKFRPILASHLEREQSSKFQRYLRETIARLDLVIGDSKARIAAARTLGDIGTVAGEGTLAHALDNAVLDKQADVEASEREALARVESYQKKVRLAESTFAGLSLGSILVLLALGLSIIFGLMGVINMAHGEFMMVGAFATWGVSNLFAAAFPKYFDYYLIAAVPAAFLASALVGWLCEVLVVRHLYGRPLDTLLATWGIGLILIWASRREFGSNMHINPPHWLEGSLEVAPDLFLARNRVFIIAYCMACVGFVYFIVNRTKLGLLLRATTQSRQMASALGVATRRVDAFTFAMGAGLAGLAGVAVTMVDKINPRMGQDYVVDSFMVVVVGGVGKLAGAICAGFGLGFITKYLEPILGSVKSMASGASVFTKVIVLAAIVAFLQWRPQGLFPPKGRLSDA